MHFTCMMIVFNKMGFFHPRKKQKLSFLIVQPKQAEHLQFTGNIYFLLITI